MGNKDLVKEIINAETENNDIGGRCFFAGEECFKAHDFKEMEYYFQKAEKFFGAASSGYKNGIFFEDMKKMRAEAQLYVFENASKLNGLDSEEKNV